jgi:toxin ParE1/3/4
MRRFRLSPLAKSDLADIRHFIRQDKPAAASRQIAKFYDAFETLGRHSELGQQRPELGPDLRTFSTGTYVIVYRPFARGVEVVRILSGYRDVEALFGASHL